MSLQPKEGTALIARDLAGGASATLPKKREEVIEEETVSQLAQTMKDSKGKRSKNLNLPPGTAQLNMSTNSGKPIQKAKDDRIEDELMDFSAATTDF
jgi:hypothetical protein